MTNITIPATKAKTSFAKLIDTARIEPVTVTRNNRAIAVVLSPEEFERLSATDDAYWVEQASKAKKGGFVGAWKSLDFLSTVLDAKD